MGRLTLILGGVRSGKSRLAEQMAAATPPVTYLATARTGDAEMTERVARHRARRADQQPPWRTVEEPWEVPAMLAAQVDAGAVLVECVPLWLTNLLLGVPGREPLTVPAIAAAVASLEDAAGAISAQVYLVSAEVGWGLLPPNDLGRRFADLLGEANQLLAARADEVVACVAGLPLRLKEAGR